MLVDDTVMKQVFVYGQSTSSAWRFALLGAKTAFTQWAIGIGHLGLFHVMAANFQAHFLTTMPASHPLTKVLTPFLKFTMQFDTLILLNLVSIRGLPYENNEPNLTRFLPILQGWDTLSARNGYLDNLPSRIWARNCLDAASWNTVVRTIRCKCLKAML